MEFTPNCTISLRYCMRIKSKVWIGSVFCILSACLWGVSGAVGQYLFNQAGISPEWLVSARCLLTGLLLLVFYQVKHGGVFSIWMDRQDIIGIIIFALGGMLFMQSPYKKITTLYLPEISA